MIVVVIKVHKILNIYSCKASSYNSSGEPSVFHHLVKGANIDADIASVFGADTGLGMPLWHRVSTSR